MIDPDFELSLGIALRMLPRHLVTTAASAKLPHERDAAFGALAAGIVEQLRLSGWSVVKPPKAAIDRGV